MTITLIKVDHDYIYFQYDFQQKTKSARLNTRQKPGCIREAYKFIKAKETRLAVTLRL